MKDPDAITRTYGSGGVGFDGEVDDVDDDDEASSQRALDRHVAVRGAPPRLASEKLMDLLMDGDRPPTGPTTATAPAPAPSAGEDLLTAAHSRRSRRAPGAAPPSLPSYFGGYEADQARMLLGGLTQAMKGQWVDPAAASAGEIDSWARLMEEEGSGVGGGRVRTAVDARFTSAGLLMADLADARRTQIKSSAPHRRRPLDAEYKERELIESSRKFTTSMTLRRNQNATNVAATRKDKDFGVDKDTYMDKATSEGVGIEGIKKDVDDEWMRMMRRRVEARAAAAMSK